LLAEERKGDELGGSTIIGGRKFYLGRSARKGEEGDAKTGISLTKKERFLFEKRP